MKYWIRDIYNLIYYYIFLILSLFNSRSRKIFKKNKIYIDWRGRFYFAIYFDDLSFINNPDIVKKKIIDDKKPFFDFLSSKKIDEILIPDIKYINNTNTFLIRLKIIKLFQYHLLVNFILLLLSIFLIIKIFLWK